MTEKEILQRVSRSFYLTLRLLPRPMRAEASLGYLLARATDTLADSAASDLPRRAEILRAAQASLDAPSIAGYDPAGWTDGLRDAAERCLLSELPALWRRMHAAEEGTRGRLRCVLGHILEGQLIDLERFGADAGPLGDDELQRYIYLVAGSVGEFWTDLCAARLGVFASAPLEVMRHRGRAYGEGLQLVNILRDRAMDAALGRCYVVVSDVPRWRKRASHLLDEGGSWCVAVRPGRLRYASLLPALLGFRTLALSSAADEGALTPRKVSRGEVRRWMWRALPVWASADAVPRLVSAVRT
ncbi:MAG: squalene/phytoene synthase family protein [Chthoniobacterales bacterium]